MATEVTLPELGENITSGDVIKVLVNVGDSIEAEQPIIEVETDKAAIEVPSPASGQVTAIHIKEGESANVGQKLISLDAKEATTTNNGASNGQATATKTETKSSEEKKVVPDQAVQTKPVPAAAFSTNDALPAAPSARRRARELGVDLAKVRGSGPGGRISIADVENFDPKQSASSPVQTTTIAPVTLPDFSKWGAIEVEKMSNVRKATAIHLSQVLATVPQVTQYDKADITDVEKLRKQYAEKAKAVGGKLTITAILLRVVGSALKQFPKFNSSIDMQNQSVIYKKYINVGIAVDTERGLLVPVVRDVEQKNILQLAKELTEISSKARDRKTSIEEMQGGNFTITNLGGIGGIGFSPIVNGPEVAILGVSRASIEPVYRDGFFSPRQMMPLSLSYDHRIIDGADAARFLRWIVEALEQPSMLSFEG